MKLGKWTEIQLDKPESEVEFCFVCWKNGSVSIEEIKYGVEWVSASHYMPIYGLNKPGFDLTTMSPIILEK